MARSERYERGAALLKEKRPDEYKNLTENFKDVPEIADFVIEFAYGDIWSRPGLDLKQRAFVVVSTLAALGGAEPYLKSHIGGALKAGCTVKELTEAFLQMIPYAGFPRAISAIRCLKEVAGG